MSQNRARHTASLLADGSVLVAGGHNNDFIYQSTAQRYILSPLGSACSAASDCQSGFCVDGVCCNSACNAGPCDACSVAAGAPVNGGCAFVNGKACDDGNGCTQNDTCQAGVCAGANATGPACDDGNACTQNDTCQAGVCTAGDPVACAALDSCHAAGVCAAATGKCTNPEKPDGTACAGGTCAAGVCVSTPDGSGSGSGGGSGGGSGSGDGSGSGSGGGSGSGSGGGSGGTPEMSGGCGCDVVGAPGLSLSWLSLGLLLALLRARQLHRAGRA
jgi:uncharacterized membrane protein YgcG